MFVQLEYNIVTDCQEEVWHGAPPLYYYIKHTDM